MACAVAPHWYKKFVEVLVQQLDFTRCENNPCMLMGRLVEGEPPVYVGVYVDNFLYFSKSDTEEKGFETQLARHLTLSFIGPVSYFVGSWYQWTRSSNGLMVHISQPGYLEQLIDQYGMTDAYPVSTPYRSGLPIDWIPPNTRGQKLPNEVLDGYFLGVPLKLSYFVLIRNGYSGNFFFRFCY